MAIHGWRPTRGALFGFLMGASALSVLLPPGWTNPLKHVGQLLVPPQDLIYGISHRAAHAVAVLDLPDPSGPSEAEALRLELASQTAALEEARSENDRLRALRAESVPPGVPVLPAKVVARDVAAWRDSALVARGSLRGVSASDWVTGRFFVNQGRASGVEEGQAVLAEHCLLGRVEQVSPYMARVQLFSDVDSPRIEVRIGAIEGRKFKFVEYPCSLRGAGRGKMVIEGVDYRVVQGGEQRKDGPRRIGVGDLVFTAPGQLGLPSPMVVGRVRELLEDPMKRLVYNISAEPIVRIEELGDVYVIPIVPTTPTPIGE